MLQSLMNSISAVLVILLLTVLGFLLGRIGWLNAGAKQFLSKYIVNIAVPCMCINGLLSNLSHDDLAAAGMMLASGLVGICLCLVLAEVLAQVLRLPHKRKGVFVAMAGLSNTLNVGIPLSTELFGEECIPYVMIYYLANTLLLQTAGIAVISRAGQQEGTPIHPLGILRDLLRRPPVLAVIAGTLLLALDLTLPRPIMSFADYISGSVAPLALIYCGYLIYEVGLRNLRLEQGLGVMLVVRFVVSPALCLLMCHLFGVTGLARSVFVVESALPVVNQAPVLASAYGADEHYAAMGMALSTIACFFVIPVLMLVL